jgi:hypothetical protein
MLAAREAPDVPNMHIPLLAVDIGTLGGAGRPPYGPI